jgi:putative MATE family efflux protein
MSGSESLVEGSISHHIFRLSGVMILGFLAMTLVHLVEIFYLGIVGLDALAAIAFSFPVTMSLSAFIRGIGIGASSIVARSNGEENIEIAAITTTHGYLMALAITFILALLGNPGANSIYQLLGARGEVLALATAYTQIWFLGYPLLGVAMVANGIIRSFGNARYPLLIMTSAPLVQVIVAPFLIFGLMGFPELGLLGAAWSSVCGAVVMFLIASYWLIKEKLFRAEFKSISVSCWNILHVGIPAAATNLIQPVGMGVTTWLLAGYGITIVAGFGVASRIESVVAMVTIGFATSIVPIVGQNWGARHFDRVHDALRTCYIACHGWGLFSAIIMWIAAPFFVRLISDDPDILTSAVEFLFIVPISLGFLGMINVATHSFNALRKPGPALILSLARLFIIYVPLALLLSNWLGYTGVFFATALSSILVGILAWLWNNHVLETERKALTA